jgi:hypothetical protein
VLTRRVPRAALVLFTGRAWYEELTEGARVSAPFLQLGRGEEGKVGRKGEENGPVREVNGPGAHRSPFLFLFIFYFIFLFSFSNFQFILDSNFQILNINHLPNENIYYLY